MIRVMLPQMVVAAVCLLASPLVSATGQYCAAMEASGPKWFAAQLDEVQATYQSGDSQEAYKQLRQAMMGLPRRADVSLDARCVGPAGWQRMYQLRRAITQSLGQSAEKTGRLSNTQGALDWYVTGDNQADARRVIPQLTPETKGTAWVISRLRNEIALLDQATAAGFELLPEEQAARKFWQRGLDGTVVYAQGKVHDVLKAEAGLQTRDASEKELAMEQAQRDSQTMASSFFGDASLTPVNEAQREVNRAKVSLDLLEAAQGWALAVAEADAIPVKRRATERGDTMLVQANITSRGPETRDLLYQAAEDYFKFANNIQRLQAAERDRAANAPALKAALDTRNAKIENKAAELKQSAQQMKQSTNKTEAEKQSFKDEADSLEAELGF